MDASAHTFSPVGTSLGPPGSFSSTGTTSALTSDTAVVPRRSGSCRARREPLQSLRDFGMKEKS